MARLSTVVASNGRRWWPGQGRSGRPQAHKQPEREVMEPLCVEVMRSPQRPFGGQGRLITYGGGHTAQQRRHLGTSLGEAEDVVDKEQHVPGFRDRGNIRQCQAPDSATRIRAPAACSSGCIPGRSLLITPPSSYLLYRSLPLAGYARQRRRMDRLAVLLGHALLINP